MREGGWKKKKKPVYAGSRGAKSKVGTESGGESRGKLSLLNFNVKRKDEQKRRRGKCRKFRG